MNVSLGPGTLYMTTEDGKFEPLGEVMEINNVMTFEEARDFDLPPRIISESHEITFTLNWSKRQQEVFFETMTGFSAALCKALDNPRVVHLIKHGKRARTREKNRMRAVRILKREGKDW